MDYKNEGKKEPLNKNSFRGSLRCSGFTLLELMVTVVIISILAAMAMPSYVRAANKARLAEAVTYIAAIERAMDMYCTQFKWSSATFLKTGGSRLDIEFKDSLDCSNAGCSSKNFTYNGSCDAGSCSITVVPNAANKWKDHLPNLTATRTPSASGLGASWSRTCSPNTKDPDICKGLIDEGFQIVK